MGKTHAACPVYRRSFVGGAGGLLGGQRSSIWIEGYEQARRSTTTRLLRLLNGNEDSFGKVAISTNATVMARVCGRR